MRKFLAEFKTFAVRGNVVDLAVAVVVGGAFGKIVTSLVDNIIMPMVGILLGGINFTDWAFTVGKATISYGKFVQSIVDFVIIAFVIFLALKAIHIQKQKEESKPAEPSEEVRLLQEIRDALKK
jgi:large conductance mechanosensitive channel